MNLCYNCQSVKWKKSSEEEEDQNNAEDDAFYSTSSPSPSSSSSGKMASGGKPETVRSFYAHAHPSLHSLTQSVAIRSPPRSDVRC